MGGGMSPTEAVHPHLSGDSGDAWAMIMPKDAVHPHLSGDSSTIQAHPEKVDRFTPT